MLTNLRRLLGIVGGRPPLPLVLAGGGVLLDIVGGLSLHRGVLLALGLLQTFPISISVRLVYKETNCLVQ